MDSVELAMIPNTVQRHLRMTLSPAGCETAIEVEETMMKHGAEMP